MNKVILIGNLGADAEKKYTQGGQCVVNIRLCTSESWTDKDGKKQERSEWHTCTYWGKGADAVHKYLAKGKKVAIEGKLQTRSWEKDGVKRFATEVNVTSLELLGGNRDNRQVTDDGQAFDGNTGEVMGGDDDIPF